MNAAPRQAASMAPQKDRFPRILLVYLCKYRLSFFLSMPWITLIYSSDKRKLACGRRKAFWLSMKGTRIVWAHGFSSEWMEMAAIRY